MCAAANLSGSPVIKRGTFPKNCGFPSRSPPVPVLSIGVCAPHGCTSPQTFMFRVPFRGTVQKCVSLGLLLPLQLTPGTPACSPGRSRIVTEPSSQMRQPRAWGTPTHSQHPISSHLTCQHGFCHIVTKMLDTNWPQHVAEMAPSSPDKGLDGPREEPGGLSQALTSAPASETPVGSTLLTRMQRS